MKYEDPFWVKFHPGFTRNEQKDEETGDEGDKIFMNYRPV